jgi:hypothetical protein
MVLLDEVELHNESFLLGGSDIKVDIGDARDHTLVLASQLMGGAEIRPDTLEKVGGFTHVKYVFPGIPHEVDARTVGQAFELLFDQLAGQLHASIYTHQYFNTGDIRNKEVRL